MTLLQINDRVRVCQTVTYYSPAIYGAFVEARFMGVLTRIMPEGEDYRYVVTADNSTKYEYFNADELERIEEEV